MQIAADTACVGGGIDIDPGVRIGSLGGSARADAGGRHFTHPLGLAAQDLHEPVIAHLPMLGRWYQWSVNAIAHCGRTTSIIYGVF
jgi:hypothetical protein